MDEETVMRTLPSGDNDRGRDHEEGTGGNPREQEGDWCGL